MFKKHIFVPPPSKNSKENPSAAVRNVWGLENLANIAIFSRKWYEIGAITMEH